MISPKVSRIAPVVTIKTNVRLPEKYESPVDKYNRKEKTAEFREHAEKAPRMQDLGEYQTNVCRFSIFFSISHLTQFSR